MRLAIIWGILLLCAVAAPTQAKVYKWTDAQGRVHYSANPPRDSGASEVRIAPTPSPAVSTDDIQAETKEEAKDEGAENKQAAEDASRKDALKQNCEIAKQNLKILENPAIRRFREEEGKEAVYYTDEQRQAKIAESKKMVEAFCQDGAE